MRKDKMRLLQNRNHDELYSNGVWDYSIEVFDDIKTQEDLYNVLQDFKEHIIKELKRPLNKNRKLESVSLPTWRKNIEVQKELGNRKDIDFNQKGRDEYYDFILNVQTENEYFKRRLPKRKEFNEVKLKLKENKELEELELINKNFKVEGNDSFSVFVYKFNNRNTIEEKLKTNFSIEESLINKEKDVRVSAIVDSSKGNSKIDFFVDYNTSQPLVWLKPNIVVESNKVSEEEIKVLLYKKLLESNLI